MKIKYSYIFFLFHIYPLPAYASDINNSGGGYTLFRLTIISALFLLISLYFNFKFKFKNIHKINSNTNTENSSRQMSEKLKKIIEFSPIGIAVTDKNNNIFSLNECFVKIFGYDSNDIHKVEEWFIRAYPDKDYKKEIVNLWIERINEYKKTGTFVPIEARVKCKNGSYKSVEVSYAEIDDFYVTTFTDLTELNQARDALIEHEKKLKRQNDNIITLINESKFFNDNFQEMLVKITEFCSDSLEIDRVSIWLNSADYKQMNCIELFERTTRQHASPEILSELKLAVIDHPRETIFSSPNVAADNRVNVEIKNYCSKNNIYSILESPILRYGTISGIIAFSNCNKCRNWSEDEKRFQTTASTLISLCMEINERRIAENKNSENERIIQNQYETLLTLMLKGRIFKGDFKQSCMEIAETCSILLEVERTGIWIYNEEKNLINCINQFQNSKKLHTEGNELNTLKFPEYISNLKNGKIISAADVYCDPAANKIPEEYYNEHNIKSLLAAPFWFDNKISGIICFESAGETKQWTVEDERFATMAGTLLSLCFEISEHKKNETALKENQERITTLINATPDIICFKDSGGKWLIANDANIELFKLRGVDYYGQTDSELADYTLPIYKEAFLSCTKSDEETWKNGVASRKEEIIPLPSGEFNTYDLIKVPIFESNNKRKGLVVFGRDITARKAIEQEIKKNEEKVRMLFENITECLAICEMIYDSNGKAIDYKFISTNRAYENLNNISAAKISGAMASQIYQDQTVAYIEEFDNVVQTKTPHQFIAFIPKYERYFNIAVVPFISRQFIIAYTEITELKNREEELKQKNEEMAKFIYTVSHDLKSPLVTIKSFADFLKKDIEKHDEAMINKDIKYIQNAADKMGILLDELLELSRISNKVSVKKEFLLSSVVKSVLDLTAGRLSKKNFSLIITNENVVLYGEEQRILEVYQNLIDNAAKFIGDQPDPKIEIGIIARNDNAPVLFVRDNGIGIDPIYHKKIFGLFEKLDVNSEGTGMGLALIKKIIETHDGKIWIESDGLGKGTTFCFTLPGTKIIKNQ